MIWERAASGSGSHGLQYVTKNQILAVTKTSAATSASRFQGDLQSGSKSAPSAYAQRAETHISSCRDSHFVKQERSIICTCIMHASVHPSCTDAALQARPVCHAILCSQVALASSDYYAIRARTTGR